MNTKIKLYEFNCYKFIKLIKKRFKFYEYNCKLYKTKNGSIALDIFPTIVSLLKQLISNPIIFETNNIHLIIQYLDNFYKFSIEFSDNIKKIENPIILTDRHEVYLDELKRLKINLIKIYEDPQPIIINEREYEATKK